MDILGNAAELTAAKFRKDNQEISLEPNSSTTYTVSTTILLPDDATASQELVGTASTQVLTNKTIDSDSNTITNIVDADIKAAAAIAATKLADGSVDNTEFQKLGTAGTDGAGELTTTDSTQTITNKTLDADNNTITNLAHGSEVDNPSSGVHGVVGTVVGTSDAQTLTTKTIDADNNTITNLAHGSEVDDPSSGVHGVTGSVVGTTDTQTLSGKTHTSPIVNTQVTGTALETDLSTSALSTKLATAAAIKTYVDSSGGGSGMFDPVDTSTGNITIASGARAGVSDFTIAAGHTYTINAGGRLAGEGAITIASTGTLTINGTVRIF